MIEAHGVTLKYPDGTVALRPFDLTIGAGELVFVTGPSGSGKTSMLQLLMGMLPPSGGDLSVLGLSMMTARGSDIRKLRCEVGPVFQEFRLTAGRNSLENVMAGIRFLKSSGVSLKREALSALECVGLAGKAFTPIEHLSWGERQRVAIARAIARNPLLVLADEPTGTLDRENAVRILSLLTSLRNDRTTVIVTTHATHLLDLASATQQIEMENGAMTVHRLNGAGAGGAGTTGIGAYSGDSNGNGLIGNVPSEAGSAENGVSI